MAVNSIIVLVLLLGVTATTVQSQGLAISGIVSCCQNCSGNAPPFPNAEVQLQCGATKVSVATTDVNGFFFMGLVNEVVEFAFLLVNNVLFLQNCQLDVYTPLVECNATLTTPGFLQSSIISSNNNPLTGLAGLLMTPAGFIFKSL